MRTYTLNAPPARVTRSTYVKPTTFRCLSVKQPWAELIVRGFKDYENRTWKAGLTGYCLVHAGKMPDPNWPAILDYVGTEQRIIIDPNVPCGCIVGMMYITGCIHHLDKGVDRDHKDYFWFQGPYAFKLDTTKAVKFEKAIPFSGKQGFFNVPIEGPVLVELQKLGLA